MSVEAVALDRLHPAEWNPRLLKEKRFKDLCRSLQADPALLERRPILATLDGTIYAGNQRYRAAQHLGWTTVPAVLDDLSPEEAKARAIRDNTSAGEWQEDEYAALLYELSAAGSDLTSLGADQRDIDRLLASVGVGGEEDAVPEPPAEPITRPGDLWLLGPHRLLCGDSTKAEDVARLMDGKRAVLLSTDPPYGVDFEGQKYNPRAKDWDGIQGDQRQGSALERWFSECLAAWLPIMEPASAFYFWTAAMEEGAAAAAAIRASGLHIQSQIIWQKNVLVLGQADYQWRHENCWYAFWKGQQHRWFGGRSQTTVWEVSKVANADYEHPMQKPVELYAIPIRNHMREGEVCVDPFAGSGTQFIAAHQLGRVCYGMEIEPRYVDVAVKRYENLTGESATREAIHAG